MDIQQPRSAQMMSLYKAKANPARMHNSKKSPAVGTINNRINWKAAMGIAIVLQ